MRKWKGILCIIVGAALILSALLLFGYNQSEDREAGTASERIVEDIRERLETGEDAAAGEGTEQQETEMTSVEIEDYEYVGYLSIPALDIELPVMSEWSYAQLRISPCRQFGSAKTDDLVIAAHNYKSHFGRLKELNIGDAVSFTDMDGVVYDYTVEKSAVLEPDSVDEVQNSGYDLVLYTCTYGGQSRVTLFCERVQE